LVPYRFRTLSPRPRYRLRLFIATLLRLCFPSWAFFDRAGTLPELQIRRHAVDKRPVTWQSALIAPARRWWHVLSFPEGTQVLATQSLVGRYCQAVLDSDADNAETMHLQRLVEYAAACALPAAWKAEGQPEASVVPRWQWRVVLDNNNDDVVHESAGLPW